MSSLNAHLKEVLADLSAELPEVTERRMFGAEAFFANSTIYAMVWDGRVLLRFPHEERFERARALEGAEKFDPMGTGKTMGRWVVMPETLSEDIDALRPWLEEAHREAMREPPKKKKKTVSSARAPARRTEKARAARTSRAGGRRGSR